MIKNITADGTTDLPMNTADHHVVISGVLDGATLTLETAGEDGVYITQEAYTAVASFVLRASQNHGYRVTTSSAGASTNVNVSFNSLA